jgi:hypothetical protein
MVAQAKRFFGLPQIQVQMPGRAGEVAGPKVGCLPRQQPKKVKRSA